MSQGKQAKLSAADAEDLVSREIQTVNIGPYVLVPDGMSEAQIPVCIVQGQQMGQDGTPVGLRQRPDWYHYRIAKSLALTSSRNFQWNDSAVQSIGGRPGKQIGFKHVINIRVSPIYL